MDNLLALTVMVEGEILKTYKDAGESDVKYSIENKSNSLTVEVLYPKHINQLFSGVWALSSKLKFEKNHIEDFNISISSSKLVVSLFK
mgnify:CR=1 FL=1